MTDLLTIGALIVILALLVGGGVYLEYRDTQDLRDLESFQRFTKVAGRWKNNKLGGK